MPVPLSTPTRQPPERVADHRDVARPCGPCRPRALRALVLLAFVGSATILCATPGAARAKPAAKSVAKPNQPAANDPAKSTLVPPKLVRYVKATYPKALFDRALRGTVVLALTLAVDGSVRALSVETSAGAQFDAAALAAGKQLLFEPARYGGKPVSVRIRFRYVFKPVFKSVVKAVIPAVQRAPTGAAKPTRQTTPARAAVSNPAKMVGRLRERGTGRAIVGALVVLPGRATETYTDGEGRFYFDDQRAGAVQVYAPGTDHKPVRRTVRLKKSTSTTVSLRAERKSYTQYRATATAPREPGQVAKRSISKQEIDRIPGVYGDSFKVVLNLPGVARPPGGAGFLIVRGSAPQDSQALVEGVVIPQLYHFGGIYSVFNTDLLEGVDFSPSGYSARYGRRLGGLVQSRLRLPRKAQPWTGYVETNVFHTGFYLRGSLGENTDIAVAGRRSYIDAVLGLLPDDLLPLTVAPRYWDAQLKIDHRLSSRTNLTLFAFASDDKLTAVVPEPPAAFPDARGSITSGIQFGGVIGTLRHNADDWTGRVTLAATPNRIGLAVGQALSFELENLDVTLRSDLELGRGPVKLRAGIDWLWNPYTISLRLPATPSNGGEPSPGGGAPGGGSVSSISQSGSFYAPGLWVDGVFAMFPVLEVVAGVRVDFFRSYRDAPGGRVRDRIDNTASPRLNVRFTANDAWTLKGATGMTSQAPQPQELSPAPFGTPSLGAQRAFETTLGLERKLTDAIDVDVQVFHKRLWNLVVPTGATFGGDVYGNTATGQVTGMELLLRHKPVGRFFGWVSYTLQRATRVDRPGAPERLFGWDQTHILTALGSYKLPANWEIGARWRYVSGRPYTAVQTAVWSDDNDTWTRVPSTCINCERTPAFHQLDIRVDKKFVFDRWLLGVYLDLQNAYNRANPEGITYSYDARFQTVTAGLPIIPSFGIRGEF